MAIFPTQSEANFISGNSHLRRHRAAVIGLGQVGSGFDSEPERKQIWTHVGAYLALAEHFDISGACDIDAANIEAFHRRCPGVPVFESIKELILEQAPDVVSIATPPAHHATAVKTAIALGVKTIWCEKPLTGDIASAQVLASSVKQAGARLFVSYVRRWLPLWVRVVELLSSGAIGKVRSIRVSIPNRILTMGSHGLDLLSMLGGEVRQVASVEFKELREDDEAAIAAILTFESGAVGILQPTGFQRQLIVEADIFGDDGRIRVREDCNKIEIESFSPSSSYKNYRQLSSLRSEKHAGFDNDSPFVRIATDIAEHLNGKRVPIRCGIVEALRIQALIESVSAVGEKTQSILEDPALVER